MSVLRVYQDVSLAWAGIHMSWVQGGDGVSCHPEGEQASS